MERLLENTRYIALLGVVTLLIAALVGFVWGFTEAVRGVIALVTTYGASPQMAIILIETIDIVLISTGLLFFAVSLYELFINDLELPDWMEVHDLYALKGKLSSIIILVLAGKFLEKLVTSSDYQGILYMGLGVAAVIAALVVFTVLGTRGNH
jgi:uncharacterized membrane protein YqhA